MDNQNPIALQQSALDSLIKDVYALDLKSFLVDVAKIIESLTDNQQLIEALWECAAILPMGSNKPK